MSDENKEPEKESHEGGDGKTFDMYHFFSRKDVILIALLILGLLIYLLYSQFMAETA